MSLLILGTLLLTFLCCLQSSNPGTSPPLGNGAEGIHGNSSGQSHAGNQAQPGQALPFLSQALQLPLAAAAVPIPMLNRVCHSR